MHGTILPTWLSQLNASAVRSLTIPVPRGASGFLLPTELGQLTVLHELRAIQAPSHCPLSGTMPTELALLTSLRRLEITCNRLSGTLPDLDSKYLRTLSVTRSRLSGTIPTLSVGVCERKESGDAIVTRRPYGNSECHFETSLVLRANSISGTLPARILPSVGVGLFDISHNRLSGTIPSQLGQLHRLHLRGNAALSGSLPASLLAGGGVWELDVSGSGVRSSHGYTDVQGSGARGLRYDALLDDEQAAWHHAPPRQDWPLLANAWNASSARRGMQRSRQRRAASGGGNNFTRWIRHLNASAHSPQQCCLHSCHGRGRCIGGLCSCDGSSLADGIDCGLEPPLEPPSAPPSRSSNVAGSCPKVRRHGIFVGTRGLRVSAMLPSRAGRVTGARSADCATTPVRTIDTDANGIYAPLDVFLVRLLTDASFRAPSPACAQAEWHPVFARRLSGNLDVHLKARLQARLATQRLATHSTLGASASAAATTATTNAAPTGWLTGGGPVPSLPWLHEEPLDIGPCNTPPAVYERGDVLLTYWGDTACLPPGVSAVVLPGGLRHSLTISRAAKSGGLWRASDVELADQAKVAYAASRLHAPRRRVLFFRGATNEHLADAATAAACFRPNRTDSCRGVYSLGIRQAARISMGAHPIADISRGRMPVHVYMKTLRESEFCLSAPGFGFGVRIVDYVAAACIPVVVRPFAPASGEHLLLPLEPDLDYTEFAVVIPFAQLAALPALLQNMSAVTIRWKRERMAQVHRRFLWDHEYGEAYEAVREALERRLNGRARA